MNDQNHLSSIASRFVLHWFFFANFIFGEFTFWIHRKKHFIWKVCCKREINVWTKFVVYFYLIWTEAINSVKIYWFELKCHNFWSSNVLKCFFFVLFYLKFILEHKLDAVQKMLAAKNAQVYWALYIDQVINRNKSTYSVKTKN